MQLESAVGLLAGTSWTTLLCYGVNTLAVLWLLSVLWQLCSDPLAGIPGPAYCRFSRLPYIYWVCSGQLPFRVKQLHDQYGEVFRIAPDEVQFIHPDAWKDIFGFKSQGGNEFPKDLRFYPMPPDGVRDILTADHASHGRQRRMLSHAFSEKTLREQEAIITSYIDYMVQKLRGMAAEQAGDGHALADMVKWYNYCAFDIIGDLTFGKPFFCLAESKYHPWVSTIFSSTKAGIFANNADYLPAVKWLVIAAVVALKPALVRDRWDRLKYSVARVTERLEAGTGRPDFMSRIMGEGGKAGGGGGGGGGPDLSRKELDANADLFVFAGSETTSTLLSGCTFLVLSHPEVHRRLVAEIRGRFGRPEDISFTTAQQLPYLTAVIQETFRLYPPIPVGPPRKVPEGGGRVCGHFLPKGTAVAVTQYAAGHSAANFANPESFVPERWLPDADPRFQGDRRRAVQPFSIGPRNCIGQNLAWAEIRTALIKMLWNFDAELAPESAGWIKQPVFGLWEKPPLMVNLTPREI
ncbi:hypothetical protein RB601_008541 [Gaeumannomyces tritici]